MNTCPVCKLEKKTFKKLLVHVRKHGLNARKLYTKLNCSGFEPLCACGCGQHVRFIGIELGFETYRRSHGDNASARVVTSSQESNVGTQG